MIGPMSGLLVLLLLSVTLLSLCPEELKDESVSVSERYRIERLLRIPTSPQWKQPSFDLPFASIREIAPSIGAENKTPTYRTKVDQKHQLKVYSLRTSMGALIDPDTGLYTMGNALIGSTGQITDRYERNQRWWRYPGNYLYRGSEWERNGTLEIVGSGVPRPIKWRINGNNTRGFPIKAIRIYYQDQKPGRSRIILRAAGNDYDRMYMRDAFQHNLCTDMLFDTMDAEPIVLYINGAYWGIHYIRPRIDELEIARRYNLDKNDVTIFEDMVEYYRGNRREGPEFWAMIDSLEKLGNAPHHIVPFAEARIDINNFLQYMSAQMILGNKDWPYQNLKYWKYTGSDTQDSSAADGRWRFIMGDSDLAFGYEGPHMVEFDMFRHVYKNNGAIARLFKALMRSSELRDRFEMIMQAQLDGPLSSNTMVVELERMSDLIENEIELHIDRWGRPRNKESWEKALDVGYHYAMFRPGHVYTQLRHFMNWSSDIDG